VTIQFASSKERLNRKVQPPRDVAQSSPGTMMVMAGWGSSMSRVPQVATSCTKRARRLSFATCSEYVTAKRRPSKVDATGRAYFLSR